MPSLIANQNKKVAETRLSKAYNVMTNAIRLSENDNGMMKDWPNGANMNVNEFWETYLRPYFNGVRLCETCASCGYPANCTNASFSNKWAGGGKWGLQTSSSRLLFQLNDGTVIFFPRNSQNASGDPVYVSDLFIDINGPKNPNEAGKDVFHFMRDYENGTITAFEGKCKDNVKYCAYEIMSNGWKIPEDYPYRL